MRERVTLVDMKGREDPSLKQRSLSRGGPGSLSNPVVGRIFI